MSAARLERLGRLLDDFASADIILISDDGVSLPAHRVILSSASAPLGLLVGAPEPPSAPAAPYSSLALDAHLSRLPRIAVRGHGVDTLRSVLRFVYTGATEVNVSNAVELLVAAEKFDLPDLGALAQRLLPRLLRDDNACALLQRGAECVCVAPLPHTPIRAHTPPQCPASAACVPLFRAASPLRRIPPPYFLHARRSHTPALIAASSSYILRHFDGVAESAAWLGLPRPLLAALLRSSELATVGELRVLQAAIRWGLANLPPGGGIPEPAAAAAAGASPATAARMGVLSAAAAAAGVEAVEAYGGALRASGGPSSLGAATSTPAEGLLPPLPPAAVPALRALLAPACPALRLAQLPLHVLRSAAVTALVPAELTLAAVFHKLAMEQDAAAAAAAGAAAPPRITLAGWGSSAGGGGSGEGARRGAAAAAPAPGAGTPLSARLADALQHLDALVERSAERRGERGGGGSGGRTRGGAGEGGGALSVGGGAALGVGAPPAAPVSLALTAAPPRLGGGLLGPSLHSPFPSFFADTALGVGGGGALGGSLGAAPFSAAEAGAPLAAAGRFSLDGAPVALHGRGGGGAGAGAAASSASSPPLPAPPLLPAPALGGVDAGVLAVVIGAGGGGAAGEPPFSRRFADLRADGAHAHALLCKGVISGGGGGGAGAAPPATPTPASLPPISLRFDVHFSHASSVLLSNAGRTAAVVAGDPFFWHSSGVAEAEGVGGAAAAATAAAAYPAAAAYAAAGGGSGGSPRRGGPHSFVKPPRPGVAPPAAGVGGGVAPAEDILLPVLPLLSLPSAESASATAAAAAQGWAVPGNAPRRGAPPPPLLADGSLAHLPIGRFTVSLVIDDSASLDGFEPESARVAEAAAAWEGEAAFLYAAAASGSLSAPSLLHLPPLDLALCVLSAPSDIDGGGASAGGGGSEPQVLWMHTNSGHVLARQPAGGPGVGPLRHLCSGLPWGVGSALTLTVDSATGDVGVAVANDGGGPGVGSAAESSGAPAPAAPPPPPFALLPPSLLSELAPTQYVPAAPAPAPWGAPGAAAPPPVRVLHAANPAAGPRARVHAALSRLPLAAVAEAARGLQVALLCRGDGGVIATLIPGPTVVA
jgi:hypothetical protein